LKRIKIADSEGLIIAKKREERFDCQLKQLPLVVDLLKALQQSSQLR